MKKRTRRRSYDGATAIRLTLMSCGIAPLSSTLWIWLTDPAAMLLRVQHACAVVKI